MNILTFKRKKVALVLFIFILVAQFNMFSTFASNNEKKIVKINNTELEFLQILYVDGDVGSDEKGNGDINQPFKTIQKAVEKCLDKGSLIILKGKDVTPTIEISVKDITIIGDYLNHNSIIHSTFASNSGAVKGSTTFYGVKLDGVNTNAWGETFSNLTKVNLFNCVFDEKSGYSNVYIQESNIKNCFIVKSGENYNIPTYVNSVFEKAGFTVDSKYNLTSDSKLWANIGTGENPDGSKAHLGVYGGPFAWEVNQPYYTVIDNATPQKILTFETENNTKRVHEIFKLDMYMQNIKEIAAEDLLIQYDPAYLAFEGFKEKEGIKIVYSNAQKGEIRVVMASLGEKNVINTKTMLANMNFRALKKGETTVSYHKAKVTDGLTYEKPLKAEELGDILLYIKEPQFLDVNKSGKYTLLDLGILARHFNALLPNDLYILDQFEDGKVDDLDLIEVYKRILENPEYTFESEAN